MPSLKALRKRIGTVRSTQQITKAMKMVAAAKLRRAQEAAERARPYSGKLAEMFVAVAGEIDPDSHPLLARRDEKRIDLVLITSDRGLCGGYNANLVRKAQAFLREHPGAEVSLVTVGRKGHEAFRGGATRILAQRIGFVQQPASQVSGGLAEELTARFVAAETDAVYLIYSAFRSAISQVPTVTQLLPVPLPETREAAVEYIFEPERPALLERLLPAYIAARLTQAILEAIASEHGARMSAMDNATRNAADMMERLTLSMNRARQATITTELMEIVSGAEALKG